MKLIPHTEIKIKDPTKIKEYIKIMKEIEYISIQKCNEIFGDRCRNKKTKKGILYQKGGTGKNQKNTNINDVNKFYFYYEKK